jgi:hypothetical protein
MGRFYGRFELPFSGLAIEFLISSKTKSGGSFTDWLPGVPAAGLRESQQVACGSSSGWLSSGWLLGVPAAGLREFQRLASGSSISFSVTKFSCGRRSRWRVDYFGLCELFEAERPK